MSVQIDSDTRANGQFYKDELLHHDSLSGQHKPLFRLLCIEPGQFGDAIKAQLKTCELENAPPYNALSYSWGEKAGLEIIHLNGGFHFRVRRNLENALQRLRHPTDTVIVWIDGICINQANIPERSAQVRQMGAIYSRADQVLVWLGETRALPDADLPMYGAALGLVQQGEKVWWQRLWVVQESTSAQRLPKILFGQTTMDWKPFVEQWRDLCAWTANSDSTEPRSPESEFFNDGLNKLRMLGDLWSVGPRHSTLYQMLACTRGYICSDDHDRIYALLHLLHESEQRIFTPDYNRPLQQLYAEATAHLIRSETDGFDLLLRHWNRGSKTSPNGWWLDFTRPMQQAAMPFFSLRQNASAYLKPGIELAITETGNSNCPGSVSTIQPRLHARGFLVDEIDMTRPFRSLFDPKTGDLDILKWISFFKHIRLREKAGFIRYFTYRKDKRRMQYSKKQCLISSQMRAIRLGLLKSLLALYRRYAEDLSPRMKRTLDLLEAIPDDIFRPTTEELDTPDEMMVERLDAEVIAHLSFLMKRALRLLGEYDIFITTHGYVGFSRTAPNVNSSTSARPRDLVVVLHGGSVPFLLRRPDPEDSISWTEKLSTWNWSHKDETEIFSIVDGCCVPAIMRGELVELAKGGHLDARCFTLGESSSIQQFSEDLTLVGFSSASSSSSKDKSPV